MGRAGGLMQVRLFGDIEVVDDAPIAVGGPTQRRVLAALALGRGDVVSVGRLVEATWPDGDPPDRAEHNVRTYVHRLRGALDGHGDLIETAGAGYRLAITRDDLDLTRFEDRATAAVRSASTGDTMSALDAIADAEELWRGGPLVEFEHEPWARAEVVRLTEIHTELRTRHAAALIDVGRPGEAIAELEVLVRDEPLREEPRALLMRALYESGRQAEALRAYQDFRASLIDEVGTEPSDDLTALDRSIARGELVSSAERPTTIGSYVLHERIGEGAFAVVHRAVQTSLGREVAMKIVRAELADRPEFIRRFEAEAQMVAAVEHPSVVPLYDYWREPGQAYLVMRWMTGGNLDERLDRGAMPLGATVELVEQLAGALDAAHAQGVVHRDVKPANVLFDDRGLAYLGDFGIALAAEERANPQAALSEGSPLFASPEQLRREPAGPEADVFALGIVAFTCLVGHTPFADVVDDAARLHHQLDEPIPPITSLVPGLPAAVDDVLARATAKRPGDRYPTATGFASAFRAAATATPEPRPASVVERRNPFKGLKAFDETDAGDFHGRTRLVDELVAHLRLSERRFVAVVGPSGSGKSSVVRAGLVPALRAGRVPGSDDWFTTTMIPGTHPYEALESALLRVATSPPASLLDVLRDGERGILRGARRTVPDDHTMLVVVIDQFEELFTAAVGEEDRDRFLRAVTIAATEPRSPVRFVITLRADFYDRPLRHPEFAPLLRRNTVAIAPLAPDELDEAIARPVEAIGMSVEPGLVAEVVADLNSSPGALPLMQYALTRTFDDSPPGLLTVDAYRSIGGLSGALTARADELLATLNDHEVSAARRLFGRLVVLGEGTEDTRRRVRRSELVSDDASAVVLDRFGAARLLTFDRDPATREPTVEIAHEALIREWPQLRNWLDRDRDVLRVHRDVTNAATRWEQSDHEPSELYRGARLAAAEPLLTSGTVELNATEREFLGAGVARRAAEESEEQARVRRLRRLVVATATVAVIALVAGGVALFQWDRADDQAAAATAQAERADLARMRSASFDVAERNPSLALLLAAEAHRMDPSRASQDALQRILTGGGGFDGAIPGLFLDVELLDEGRLAAVLTYDGVEVWDLNTRARVRTVARDSGPFSGFTGSATGGLVAVYDANGLDVVDPLAGDVIHAVDEAASNWHAAMSPDAETLAVSTGTAIEFWDLTNPGAPVATTTPLADVRHVAWHPDGTSFVVVLDDGRVQYWLNGATEPEWERPGFVPSGDVAVPPATLFGRFDDIVVVAVDESTGTIVRAHRLDDGDVVAGPVRQRSGLLDLNWNDERRLRIDATANPAGALTIDLGAGELAEPRFPASAARAVEYSVALDRIVEAGTDGIRLWRPDGRSRLERVLPLTAEPDDSVTASQIGTVLIDGGASVLVSGNRGPDVPEGQIVEYDLTRVDAEPSDTGLRGVALGANGHAVRVDWEGAVWLDDQLGEISETMDVIAGPASMTSPGGRYFAAQTWTGISIFRSTGEPVAEIAPTFAVDGFSFSRDGSRVVAYSLDADGTWSVYDTETGELLEEGDPSEFIRPWQSGDAWYAQRSIGDFTIVRIDPDTREVLGEFVGHNGGRHQALERPEAGLVATSSYDGSVRVWDIESGDQIGREIEAWWDIRFSDDGTKLVVTHDTHVSVWNYDTTTWVDIACDIAGRNMTPEEWSEWGPETIDRRATCDEYALDPRGGV